MSVVDQNMASRNLDPFSPLLFVLAFLDLNTWLGVSLVQYPFILIGLGLCIWGNMDGNRIYIAWHDWIGGLPIGTLVLSCLGGVLFYNLVSFLVSFLIIF